MFLGFDAKTILLVCGGAFVVGLIYHRRINRVTEPSCRHCGYCVRGLTHFVCPECGLDLREVGICIPGDHRAIPPLIKGVLWTLLMPVLMVLTFQTFERQLPTFYREDRSTRLTPIGNTTTGEIDIATEGEGYSQPTRPRQIQMVQGKMFGQGLHQPTRSNRNSRIEIELADLTYRIISPGSEVSSRPLSEQVIYQWRGPGENEAIDAAVRAQARELYSFVTEACRGSNLAQTRFTQFRSSGVSMGVVGNPPRWSLTALVSFWILVWIVGLWRVRKARAQRNSAVLDSNV